MEDLDHIQAARDLLKANFNPNSDLNKFSPNRSTWKFLDKSDLIPPFYSTEFSLDPVQARRVVSVGRVLGPDGRLLAVRSLSATVSPAKVVRLSTQAEFVCDNLGDLDRPGDETGLRLPGQAGLPYLSRSDDATGGKTWGYALGQPGLGTNGAGLQTYPEPCVNAGSGFSISPAFFDGNLQLATVETATDAPYGGGAGTMMCLGRYATGFDLEVAHGPAANQTDTDQVSGAEMANSVWDAAKPNTLYPDGVYSEKAHAPAYRDLGNAHGLHGLMSFWVKENFRHVFVPGMSGAGGNMRGRPLVDRTNVRLAWNSWEDPAVDPPHVSWGFDSANQFFLLGDTPRDVVISSSWNGVLHRRTVCHFEIGHATDDGLSTSVPSKEHRWQTPDRTNLDRAHRWQLMTFYWNYQAPSRPDIAALLVDGGTAPIDQGTPTYSTSQLWTWYSDITLDDAYGPHLMTLGMRRSQAYDDVGLAFGTGADSTFDEFAIWDFGQNPACAAPVAVNRWHDGRYYKGAAYAEAWNPSITAGEAGSWLSAPIRLPAGSRLLKVCWSWQKPLALPDDYAELELVNPQATEWLWNNNPALSRSTQAAGFGYDRQSWDVGRSLPGSFRARVDFRRIQGSATVDLNTPILDSPVFDDLSLLYTPASGPAVLSWGDGD